jgi:hypothetical protein
MDDLEAVLQKSIRGCTEDVEQATSAIIYLEAKDDFLDQLVDLFHSSSDRSTRQVCSFYIAKQVRQRWDAFDAARRELVVQALLTMIAASNISDFVSCFLEVLDVILSSSPEYLPAVLETLDSVSSRLLQLRAYSEIIKSLPPGCAARVAELIAFAWDSGDPRLAMAALDLLRSCPFESDEFAPIWSKMAAVSQNVGQFRASDQKIFWAFVSCFINVGHFSDTDIQLIFAAAFAIAADSEIQTDLRLPALFAFGPMIPLLPEQHIGQIIEVAQDLAIVLVQIENQIPFDALHLIDLCLQTWNNQFEFCRQKIEVAFGDSRPAECIVALSLLTGDSVELQDDELIRDAIIASLEGDVDLLQEAAVRVLGRFQSSQFSNQFLDILAKLLIHWLIEDNPLADPGIDTLESLVRIAELPSDFHLIEEFWASKSAIPADRQISFVNCVAIVGVCQREISPEIMAEITATIRQGLGDSESGGTFSSSLLLLSTISHMTHFDLDPTELLPIVEFGFDQEPHATLVFLHNFARSTGSRYGRFLSACFERVLSLLQSADKQLIRMPAVAAGSLLLRYGVDKSRTNDFFSLLLDEIDLGKGGTRKTFLRGLNSLLQFVDLELLVRYFNILIQRLSQIEDDATEFRELVKAIARIIEFSDAPVFVEPIELLLKDLIQKGMNVPNSERAVMSFAIAKLISRFWKFGSVMNPALFAFCLQSIADPALLSPSDAIFALSGKVPITESESTALNEVLPGLVEAATGKYDQLSLVQLLVSIIESENPLAAILNDFVHIFSTWLDGGIETGSQELTTWLLRLFFNMARQSPEFPPELLATAIHYLFEVDSPKFAAMFAAFLTFCAAGQPWPVEIMIDVALQLGRVFVMTPQERVKRELCPDLVNHAGHCLAALLTTEAVQFRISEQYGELFPSPKAVECEL